MTFPDHSAKVVPLRKKEEVTIMRDSVVRAAFQSEGEKCECGLCQALVRAIFAVWLNEQLRDKLMDLFVDHAAECVYHSYAARQ